MTHLTEQKLREFVEAAQERATWKVVAARLGIGIGTVYGWIARSKMDAKTNLGKDSPFWLDVPPFGYAYFHDHVRRSRVFFQLAMEQQALDVCSGNQTEIVYNPQTGQPLQALNPLYAHRDDSWFVEYGLDPAIDKYLWVRDDLTDDIVAPVYVRREVKPPAQLLIKALAAMLPKTWSEKSEVNHSINGQVVHQLVPPKFVSRTPQGDDDVVEGEYSEVREALSAPEREDIQDLRRRAAAVMANPNRPTSMPSAPVDLGSAPPDLKPTSEYAGGPKHGHDPQALSTPKPQRDRPSYARRDVRDPRAPGARAMKVG
jgi:hypothetical protein